MAYVSAVASLKLLTAPAAGHYEIRAKFSGRDTATTDVHVVQNGQPIFTGFINGQGATQSFTTTVAVAAGEPIDFAVGPNGSFYSDTTFVDVRIVLISGP